MKSIEYEKIRNYTYMQVPENATLIRQLNEGNDRDFTRIFELFSKDVKTYAYYLLDNQEDAEDVVQELFLRLWKKRGSLNIRGDLRTYLISATHNISTTRFNKNKNYALRKQRYAEDLDPQQVEQLSFDKDSELMAQVREILKTVPPKSREAFEMIYFGQMSYKEAAARAGVSEATLKTLVQRVLKVIRPKLGGRKIKGSSKKVLMLVIYFLSQSCL